MLGDVGLVEQRDTAVQGAGGEILRQLQAHRRVGDDAGRGQVLFDLAADVGGVPRRPPRPQPRQHHRHDLLAVQLPDRRQGQRRRAGHEST